MPQFLRFESRPTSIARLGKMALAALFVAIPCCLFVAPMIVQYQYAALSPGDPVIVTVPGAGEAWNVVETDGHTVTVRSKAGRVETFDVAVVHEQ